MNRIHSICIHIYINNERGVVRQLHTGYNMCVTLLECGSQATRVRPSVNTGDYAKEGRHNAPVVITILRDVTDPRECLVAAFLDDLQVSDLDAGDGEVWNLELYGDRGALVQ